MSTTPEPPLPSHPNRARTRRLDRVLVGVAGVALIAGLAAAAARGAGSADTAATQQAPSASASASASGSASPSSPQPDPTPTTSTTTDDASTPSTPANPSATTPLTSAADPAAVSGWTVTRVVDGDTIHASRNGVTEKVRIIGIDTPEVGQCGYAEATQNLVLTIGGRPVTLTPGARDNQDKYGRYLRYVDVDGTDAGLRQIQGGYGIARYDSRDGYGNHPREATYIAADAATPKAPCSLASKPANPPPSPSPTTAPVAPTPKAPATSGWVPGSGYACPAGYPIKGNDSSMIAHTPSSRTYGKTKPEKCFATMSDANAAGYRAARD